MKLMCYFVEVKKLLMLVQCCDIFYDNWATFILTSRVGSRSWEGYGQYYSVGGKTRIIFGGILVLLRLQKPHIHTQTRYE